MTDISLEADREKGFVLFKKSFLFLVSLALLGLAFFSGYERGQQSTSLVGDDPILASQAVLLNQNERQNEVDFALFWKVWDILKEKFVDKSELDAKKMLYGAIDGMLASTDDPYTTFFDPEENQQFQEDITGNFDGIGAEMGIKDEVLTIIAPLDDTPASRAGLMAGDKVLKIDGESTANQTIDESVHRIRGKKGTSVTLNIFHEGDEEAKDVVVQRDTIHVKSVRFEMKDDIAYIRLSRFGEETTGEYQEAARLVLSAKAKGLVLDMRNNPGGLLEGAVDIASLMLPNNTVVVIEENGKGIRKELQTNGGEILTDIPTSVLINEGSASASEILAGALRENREDVRIFGETSYGKGSVQQLIDVTKDTAVKITIAKWLTPKGNQINKIGIAPDEEVSLTRDDVIQKRDPQLDKALEWIRSQR